MTAHTTKRDGTVVRWHLGVRPGVIELLDECERPECYERHATLAELGADLDSAHRLEASEDGR